MCTIISNACPLPLAPISRKNPLARASDTHSTSLSSGIPLHPALHIRLSFYLPFPTSLPIRFD